MECSKQQISVDLFCCCGANFNDLASLSILPHLTGGTRDHMSSPPLVTMCRSDIELPSILNWINWWKVWCGHNESIDNQIRMGERDACQVQWPPTSPSSRSHCLKDIERHQSSLTLWQFIDSKCWSMRIPSDRQWEGSHHSIQARRGHRYGSVWKYVRGIRVTINEVV